MGDDALDPADYTIVWFAPQLVEAVAAVRMFDKLHDGHFAVRPGDDYLYTPGELNGHNIIIATFPANHDYGLGSAAALASQVKKTFRNIWFGLLVGVAAGLPRHDRDIRLGDVLVGLGLGEDSGIVNYGLGKETEQGSQLIRQGRQPRTETIIRSAIGQIQLRSYLQGNTFLRYYDEVEEVEYDDFTFSDPGPEKDTLYEVVTSGDIRENRPIIRPPRTQSKRTRVWYGSIGSSDRLVKNAQKRDELRDSFNLIGLDMEGAGIMNIIPVGVIRGVCSYGDEQETEEWVAYAAAMAAAYAKQILHTISPATKGSKGKTREGQAEPRMRQERRRQTCTPDLTKPLYQQKT